MRAIVFIILQIFFETRTVFYLTIIHRSGQSVYLTEVFQSIERIEKKQKNLYSKSVSPSRVSYLS